MISRHNQVCPSVDALSVLLEPHATIPRELDHHLGSCVSCRETLSHLAGESTWWEQATEALGAKVDQRSWSASICALATSTSPNQDDAPLCQHELQQLQSLLEPPSHPELIGRIGRYELEQLIGRGGMGLVFRARDMELHRVVAVKTLAVHLIPIGAARSRFVREARATASLTHPHIVPVYDVITEGEIPAIVMQYIAGPTLEQQLFEKGPFAWHDVLQIGIQLAEALVIAHGGDLIHRDIKPGNVLLDAGGARALLTDFGLVRALDDATLTRSGVLAGTPDYMSPEQARGDTLTASSDLFSLGSLLYTMLTGHPPFRAENPMAVMNRICHEKARPLREACPEVPVELSQLVERLLAKSPRKRFESAEHVCERMRQLASSPHRLRRPMRQWKIAALAGISCIALSMAWFAFSTSQPSERTSRSLGEQAAGMSDDTRPPSKLDASPGGTNATLLKEQARLNEQVSREIDQRLKQLRADAERAAGHGLGPIDKADDKSPKFDAMDAALLDLKRELLRAELHLFPSRE